VGGKARKTADPLDIEPPRCTLSPVLGAGRVHPRLKVGKEDVAQLTLSLPGAL
jgi:hypothetical protein